MLTAFGLLAGNLISVHSGQRMRSAIVFYCVVIFFFFGHGPDGIPLNLGIAYIIEYELPNLVEPLTKVTVWSHWMFLKWMVNGEKTLCQSVQMKAKQLFTVI